MFHVKITPSPRDMGRKFDTWAQTNPHMAGVRGYSFTAKSVAYLFSFLTKKQQDEFLTLVRMSNWLPYELTISHDEEVVDSWYVNTPQGIKEYD